MISWSSLRECIRSEVYVPVDVAVDPVDGTRLTAEGHRGALAVIAVAERGSMYAPAVLSMWTSLQSALLRGVRFGGIHTSTHSVIMRSQSGTVRFVGADHRVEWVEGEIKL